MLHIRFSPTHDIIPHFEQNRLRCWNRMVLDLRVHWNHCSSLALSNLQFSEQWPASFFINSDLGSSYASAKIATTRVLGFSERVVIWISRIWWCISPNVEDVGVVSCWTMSSHVNKTLVTRNIQFDWEAIAVTPIQKNGSKHDCTNCKHVGLTANPCKIMWYHPATSNSE